MSRQKATWLRLPVVSAGSEYLVMGHHMRRNILTYKAPPNNEGYDLICIHPDPRHQPKSDEAAQIRVQVKSRYATDCDRGFPVKEASLDAFDFLIVAFLNIGKFYGKNDGSTGKQEAEFYTLPNDFIREHHDTSSTWQKVRLRKLEQEIKPFKNEVGFSLDDYQPFSDTSAGMNEIVRFVRTAVEEDEGQLRHEDGDVFVVSSAESSAIEQRFSTDRDAAIDVENVELLGLDHPKVVQYMQQYQTVPETEIGIRVRSDDDRTGVLSIWHISTQGDKGETQNLMLTLAIDRDGQRVPAWEKQIDRIFQLPPANTNDETQLNLLAETLEPMIHRELIHRGFLGENRGYDARLVGWVEVV